MSFIRKLRVVTKIGSADSSAIPALSQGILATVPNLRFRIYFLISTAPNFIGTQETIVSRAFSSFQLLTRERRRKTTTSGADFILRTYGQRG
jgi:hypothetical protein